MVRFNSAFHWPFEESRMGERPTSPLRRLGPSVPLLPALALFLLPAGFLPAADENSKEAGPGQGGAAGAIVSRLDGMSIDSLWDSVARLEALGKEAIPAIRSAASGAGEKAQLGAAKALIDLGDDAVRKEALKKVAALAEKATDREVRAAAIDLLGSEDPEGSGELLRQIFEASSSTPEVLIPAARVLWELDQEPRARKRLLDLVQSRDRRVRYPAALALAEIHCFEGPVRETLRELRQEPSARGRLAQSLLSVDRMARQEERE